MLSPKASARIVLGFGLLLALGTGCARSKDAAGNQPAVTPEHETDEHAMVTAEDIERTPNVPIERLLGSRFAGVIVTRAADGGIAVRIRGRTSIVGSNEPLYVIDGFPIKAGPGGSLVGINPYDIESIEVLKNAAATTYYGVRGANGVIIIKTKQPDR